MSAACNQSVAGGTLQNLTIPLAARYTAVYAAAQQPRPHCGHSTTEMRRGKVWARSNFGEAIWFNFILPVKEDA